MTRHEDKDVGRMALSVARTLWASKPGELAALRRMKDDIGAPLYWRLAARHGWQGKTLIDWAAITRMLALLTPTGQRDPAHGLQDPATPLGAALFGDGDRPLLNETRLARLLAARGDQRRAALERAVRMLARHQPRFNLPDLAWAVLNPQGGSQIARDYYKRLDRAGANDQKEETNDA